MKRSPLLSHPVELVVSPNTQEAFWKLGVAQARIVMIVATSVAREKYTATSISAMRPFTDTQLTDKLGKQRYKAAAKDIDCCCQPKDRSIYEILMPWLNCVIGSGYLDHSQDHCRNEIGHTSISEPPTGCADTGRP